MKQRIIDTIVDPAASTLIENVVALALLLSVILPVGVYLGDLALQRPAALRSEALSLARTEMEHITAGASGPAEASRVVGRFRIETESTALANGSVISVIVFRRDSDRALINLSTMIRLK